MIRQAVAHVMLLALLCPAAAGAGTSEDRRKLPEPLQPDALVMLSSYGEQPNDLIELLVPFLARHEFAIDRPRRVDDNGVATANFVSAASHAYGRDSIYVSGRYNCIVLAYYSSPYERLRRPVDGIMRSAKFRMDLEGFVQSLPTPRLRTQDLTLGTRRVACTR